MSNSDVIIFEDVSFSYNGFIALEDVNFRVKKGDFVSIVGPNGGGKTTLIKLMLGLLKPARGKIHVFGEQPEHVRTRIGYMPQSAQLDPDFPISVVNVALMGCLHKKISGYYSKQEKQATQATLEEVGILNLAGRPFSELSGGQRQRVLIARALVCKPDILLLDEPTANVDAEVEEKLHRILRKLNERMTIIVATHDLGFVSMLARNVVCVNRTVAVHPTSEINGKVIQEIYNKDLRLVRHDKLLNHNAGP
ncbi:MAG TPA: ABC transporter ATP-binding protein [Spirochaetes bacterium]|nr:ABC transporter ATP-binding protein [Spirochaetota bacterium]